MTLSLGTPTPCPLIVPSARPSKFKNLEGLILKTDLKSAQKFIAFLLTQSRLSKIFQNYGAKTTFFWLLNAFNGWESGHCPRLFDPIRAFAV